MSIANWNEATLQRWIERQVNEKFGVLRYDRIANRPANGNGVGGADANYVHTQAVPDVLWSVNHGLDKFPAVSVVDSGGNVVIPSVTYVDENNVSLTFGAASAGEAYFN